MRSGTRASKSCACPDLNYPVCGHDGVQYRTYTNVCYARCAEVKGRTPGECQESSRQRSTKRSGGGGDFGGRPSEKVAATLPARACVVEMYTESKFEGSSHILTVTRDCVGGKKEGFAPDAPRDACVYNTDSFPHSMGRVMGSVRTYGMCHRTILVKGTNRACYKRGSYDNFFLKGVDGKVGQDLPIDIEGNVCEIVVVLPSKKQNLVR